MLRREFFVRTPKELRDVKDYLEEGYMLDPIFRSNPIRLDNFAIYHLVKYSEEELEEQRVLEETVKPGEFEDVTDMAMVPFDEVKIKVQEGFVVHQVYAKGAVMLKRAVDAEEAETVES